MKLVPMIFTCNNLPNFANEEFPIMQSIAFRSRIHKPIELNQTHEGEYYPYTKEHVAFIFRQLMKGKKISDHPIAEGIIPIADEIEEDMQPPIKRRKLNPTHKGFNKGCYYNMI